MCSCIGSVCAWVCLGSAQRSDVQTCIALMFTPLSLSRLVRALLDGTYFAQRRYMLHVQAAAADDRSVLVFSGGYTRGEAGARSEAGSYWHVANAFEWFGKVGVEPRALLEDRARDSLENLLFSMCRFRQFTGRYPTRITVVSYDFKRKRFLEQHAKSLSFPLDRVVFIGTPALDPDNARKVGPNPFCDVSRFPFLREICL
jgi:hypothetical protein